MKGLAELVAEAVMTPAAAPQVPPAPRDVYYRYDGCAFAAPLNEYDEPVGKGSTMVSLFEYDVRKRTAKGAWIYTGEYDECRPKGLEGCRFILTAAHKRWACPSKEEARASFIARKRRQAGILRARAGQAELELLIAERGAFDSYIYPFDEFRLKAGEAA